MQDEGCELSWGSQGGDVGEVLRLIFLAACVAAIPKWVCVSCECDCMWVCVSVWCVLWACAGVCFKLVSLCTDVAICKQAEQQSPHKVPGVLADNTLRTRDKGREKETEKGRQIERKRHGGKERQWIMAKQPSDCSSHCVLTVTGSFPSCGYQWEKTLRQLLQGLIKQILPDK